MSGMTIRKFSMEGQEIRLYARRNTQGTPVYALDMNLNTSMDAVQLRRLCNAAREDLWNILFELDHGMIAEYERAWGTEPETRKGEGGDDRTQDGEVGR